MINDVSKQPKKSWDELVTAASEETDPDKIADLAEEIFAALEERQQSPPGVQGDNP